MCYEGYKGLAARHGFGAPFPSAEAAARRIAPLAGHEAVFGIVAEADGAAAGFNFLSERDAVRAVGPLVGDPAAQGKGVGRRLMSAVLARADRAWSVRLVTVAHNFQSLPLYASMGFDVKEPLLAIRRRSAPAAALPGYEVRPM